MFVGSTLACAIFVGDQFYEETAKTIRYLTLDTAMLLVTGLLAFVVSASVAAWATPVTQREVGGALLSEDQVEVLRRTASFLFVLTSLGYGFLALGALTRGLTPEEFLSIASSGDYSGGQLRRYFSSFGVVSIFTQLGVAFAVVAALLTVEGRQDTRLKVMLAVVVLLAGARSLLLSERLALLEVVIPLAVILLSGMLRRRGKAARWVPLAPLGVLPLFIVVFSVFESTRSYAVQGRGASVMGFGTDRLLSYYVTAYNNGQLLLLDSAPARRVPYYTVEAVWASPVATQLDLFQKWSGYDPGTRFSYLLHTQANPEYNSPGGLVVPFVDYGGLGGIAYLAIAGALIGWLYRRYQSGGMGASMVYPLLVVALAEVPRYLYWSQARFWLPVVALLLTAHVLTSTAARGRTP